MPFRRAAAHAASRNARRPAAGTSPESLERRTLFAAPSITGIDTGGDAFWNEGEYVFVGGSFTDSDANDRRTVVVDWGDGSPAHVETLAAGVRGFSTNRHAYPDDETSVLGQPRRYTITVTVTDSTFQSDTETRQITVNNVLPTIRLPLDEWVPALEGAPVTIPGNVYDPGLNDTHTFAWRVTRGSFPDVQTVFEGTARDLVFTPPDNGTYEVSVEVRDDDGGSRTATTKIWATNAPPALTVNGAAASGEGRPYELELRSTDVAADTIQSWTIDWGDGRVETIPGNPPTAGHSYDGPGHYTIRASATDEDGTYGAAPHGVAYRAGDIDRAFAAPTGRAQTDFPLPVGTNAEDALVDSAGRLLVLRTTNGPDAVEGLSLSRYNPDGSFDGSFDGDGRLFLPGRWRTDGTLALQGDGKILLAAVRTNGTMFESYLDVFRLNPDGSPDAAFGAAGIATAPVGVEHEGTFKSVHDLLLLPDGKIVVPTGSVGLFTSRMQALRFNPDGSPDATFGAGGRVEIDPPVGLKTVSASQALLAPDGRLVLVGSASGPSGTIPSTSYYGTVAMLNPDGSLDTSFASNGWITRAAGSGGVNGLAATFVPGGDLVAAYGLYSASTGWELVRYNLSGQPNAFGPDGVADPAFSYGYVTSIAPAPGDKILVAGTTSAVGASGMAVARYNADGTLDSTFGTGGKLTVPADIAGGAPAARLAPGDRVVVVGTRDKKILATRFGDNGAPDPTFGLGGLVLENRLAPWNSVGAYVRSVHVLPDKKILAVGPESGQRDLLYIARYLPDGTPDLTFGDFGRVVNRVGLGGAITSVLVDGTGKVWVNRGGAMLRFFADGSPDTAFNNAAPSFSPARHFALAPDGKIVGTGIRDTSLVVLRFNPDGTPDTTFGDAGRFEGFPGFVASSFDYEDVKAVTVQADGRIVVGGRGFARLTAAGEPDPTFGGGDGFVPAAPFIPPGWEGYGHHNFVVARGVTVGPDGRIISAWAGNQDMSPGGYAVARYLFDGTLDPSFAGDGQALYGNGIAERVALDPGGRIVVGGFGTDADADATRGFGYTAMRLLPDGTPDLSFGRDGAVAVPTAGTGVGETFVNQVAVLDAGDVLLGGMAPGGGFLLSRFRADDERALTVSVSNSAPVVSAGPDREAIPGQPVTLTGTVTDVAGDTHAFRWVVTAPGGGVVAEGTGQAITFTPTSRGQYTATFTATDDDGASASDTALVNAAPRVVGRHVFYDNSAFDGRYAGPGPADDAAVATDKRPLGVGGISVNPFASVTGYHRGLNGIMFDIAGGLPMTALAGIAGSVGLKTGAGGDPAGWADAPRPAQVGIRPGAGVGASDRVTLTWLGDAVRNAWLQVTVHAPDEWGLPDDTFVFGNLVGDTYASATSWPRVDGTDVRVVRSALATRAAVTHPGDHNRDGRVNAIDVYLVRAAQGNTLAPVTGPAPAAGAGPAGRHRPTRRDVLDPSSAPVRL